MKTKMWAILLMVFVTFLTSSAQIFYKFGANVLEFNLLSIITNYNLIIGVILYGLGAILMIISLKGGEVTVLYPIVATSYIWVSIMSIIFFNESMGIIKGIGVALIFIGVVLVGMGNEEKSMKSGEVV
ncbi:EamA family transporter [Candidatus Woesearchaeota archaeon]|nr:EamA family transporter [Candidatus Woesearchaeota archaeon]